jgi:hypothetical protein
MTSRLHTCLERNAIEENSNFLEWGERLGGITMSRVVGLVASVLTHEVALFFGFPAAGLRSAVDLGSGFLGLAVFLVSVTLGCSVASVTG